MAKAVGVAGDAVVDRCHQLAAARRRAAGRPPSPPSRGSGEQRAWRIGDQVLVAQTHVALRAAAEQDAAGQVPHVPEEGALGRSDLLHVRPCGSIRERLAARPRVRGAAGVSDEVHDAEVDPRCCREHVRVGGELRRVDDDAAPGDVGHRRVDASERRARFGTRDRACRVETRPDASQQHGREVANPAGALEQRDDAVDPRGLVEMPGLGEDAAPDGALANGHSATAEPALGQTALPEVANLAGRENTINLAEDVGQQRAAASAGACDVENTGSHQFLRVPPPPAMAA